MTTRASKPTLTWTVGIVHGGEKPCSVADEDWEGNWGCDVTCVKHSTYCFENDARFEVKQVNIQDIRYKDKILERIDVLLMPGGEDVDNPNDGPGQLSALGNEGAQKITTAVRENGLVYVGICAGAFLAHKLGLAPGLGTHDEERFGFSHARGSLNLEICNSRFSSILKPMSKNIAYEDGPAMIIESDAKDTEILATYKTPLRIARQDRERVSDSYWAAADTIVGKAAVTLSTFGKGKVLLIGPHPELCGSTKQRALVNLAAAVCETNREDNTPPAKKRRTRSNDGTV